MANERTYPYLRCRDLDQAIAFYGSLGFSKMYRQVQQPRRPLDTALHRVVREHTWLSRIVTGCGPGR